MTTNPLLSPLMENAKNTIKSSLEECLSSLEPGIQESYLDVVKSFQKNDLVTKDFFKWILHHYFMLSGYIQAAVYYCDKPVFGFGSGELLKDPSIASGDNANLGVIDLSYREKDKSLSIKGIAPARILPITKKITEMDIIPFCRNVFFFTPSLSDERKLDVYSPLEENLNRHIQKGLSMQSTVCLSHFKFKSMHVFFEFLGQQNSTEITDKIKEMLDSHFKKTDSIFQLSPVSYLVISPGIPGRKIQNRFQGIYFQIRSIILDYRILTTDLQSTPSSYAKIWEELEI